jgi:hypothetical protein
MGRSAIHGPCLILMYLKVNMACTERRQPHAKLYPKSLKRKEGDVKKLRMILKGILQI